MNRYIFMIPDNKQLRFPEGTNPDTIISKAYPDMDPPSYSLEFDCPQDASTVSRFIGEQLGVVSSTTAFTVPLYIAHDFVPYANDKEPERLAAIKQSWEDLKSIWATKLVSVTVAKANRVDGKWIGNDYVLAFKTEDDILSFAATHPELVGNVIPAEVTV